MLDVSFSPLKLLRQGLSKNLSSLSQLAQGASESQRSARLQLSSAEVSDTPPTLEFSHGF